MFSWYYLLVLSDVFVSAVRRMAVCWRWMESFSVQTEMSVPTRR